MKNSDVVCECNDVVVEDVLDYLKDPANSNKSLETKLEELDIGTVCEKCLESDCDIIDIHYSKILNVK